MYEACVGALAFVALFLNVANWQYTDSDVIIFAVTFILSLLTYSSGIIVTVALGFQMCAKRKPSTAKTDVWRLRSLRMDI